MNTLCDATWVRQKAMRELVGFDAAAGVAESSYAYESGAESSTGGDGDGGDGGDGRVRPSYSALLDQLRAAQTAIPRSVLTSLQLRTLSDEEKKRGARREGDGGDGGDRAGEAATGPDSALPPPTTPATPPTPTSALVVGGHNSSNTTHLAEIAHLAGVPAYHISEASDFLSDGRARHQPVFRGAPLGSKSPPRVGDGVLPSGEGGDTTVVTDLPFIDCLRRDAGSSRPVVLAVSSGASTPDSGLEACLQQVRSLVERK